MKLKNLNEKNLYENLFNLLNKKFNLKMQSSSKQFQQSHLLKKTRRDIARIKTMLVKNRKNQDDYNSKS